MNEDIQKLYEESLEEVFGEVKTTEDFTTETTRKITVTLPEDMTDINYKHIFIPALFQLRSQLEEEGFNRLCSLPTFSFTDTEYVIEMKLSDIVAE